MQGKADKCNKQGKADKCNKQGKADKCRGTRNSQNSR